MNIWTLVEYGYEGTHHAYFGQTKQAIVNQLVKEANETIVRETELRDILLNDGNSEDSFQVQWCDTNITKYQEFIKQADCQDPESAIAYHPDLKDYSFEEISVLI